MKTILGQICDPSTSHDTITAALNSLPPSGHGLIWVLHRNAWRIVGNFAGGRAWNGEQTQIVPASATSLASLARSRG